MSVMSRFIWWRASNSIASSAPDAAIISQCSFLRKSLNAERIFSSSSTTNTLGCNIAGSLVINKDTLNCHAIQNGADSEAFEDVLEPGENLCQQIFDTMARECWQSR